MKQGVLHRLSPRATAFAAVFALSAFAGSRTCVWEDAAGCDVAITQTDQGYQGSKNCNGTYTSIGGPGQYSTPANADCFDTRDPNTEPTVG